MKQTQTKQTSRRPTAAFGFTPEAYLICREIQSVNHLVQRILDDAFRAGGLQLRDQFAHDVLVNDRLHRHPAFLAQVGNGRVAQRGQRFAAGFARFFSAMFIFRPTFASASSAPLSSSASVSIFCASTRPSTPCDWR